MSPWFVLIVGMLYGSYLIGNALRILINGFPDEDKPGVQLQMTKQARELAWTEIHDIERREGLVPNENED